MCERGIPVVLGADAHIPTRVADGYVAALDLLTAAGYKEVSYFLDRKRHTVPIAAARASLSAGS
jgi:histidinol-phosphatase (PHP family)